MAKENTTRRDYFNSRVERMISFVPDDTKSKELIQHAANATKEKSVNGWMLRYALPLIEELARRHIAEAEKKKKGAHLKAL